MKKTFTFFIATLICTFSFAQEGDNHTTETSLPTTNTLIERPDVVIKGEELKNFLGGELSEMLFGRLPGLDHINTSNQDSKVVFVVDGIVWSNIDAININNIEEIAYYRGGLSSKLGHHNTGSAGVIFITTKTAKLNQPLRAEVNTLLGNNSFKNVEKESTFQSYNVALSQGIEKLAWRTSAVFNKSTRNLNGYDFTHQFQLNASVRYNPLKWLELKLNANYAPANGDVETTSTVSYNNSLEQATDYKQGNWNGLLSAKVSPIKGLTNEISFSRNKLSEDLNIISINTLSYENSRDRYYETLQKERTNRTVLTNDLQYRFDIDQDRINFKTGVFFQYDYAKYNAEQASYSRFLEDPDYPYSPQSLSYSRGKNNRKDLSLMGDFSVNLYDIVFIAAGVRMDKSSSFLKKENLYNSFYSATMSLKHILFNNTEKINSIDLFGSFGEYYIGTPLPGPGETNPNYANTNLLSKGNGSYVKTEMKSQNYGLKSSFFNNRLHLEGDWYRNDNYINFYINIPAVGELLPVLTTLPIKVESWRVWSSVDIFKYTPLKWNTGVNAFRYKQEIKSDQGFNIQPSNLMDDIVKPTIQAGMQQKLSYAGFSLDINAFAYFNHQVLDRQNNSNTFKFKQTSFVSLNYMYLGYDLKKQIKSTPIKSLNIGIVSRNEVYYHKNINSIPTSRTIGIALNASL